MSRVLVVLALLMLLAVTAGCSDDPAKPKTPTSSGEIIFSGWDAQGIRHLYVVSPSGVERLRNDSLPDQEPE